MLGIVSATSVGAVELVSANKDGTDSGNSNSYVNAISADGRFVVFRSDADDLVATDTNGERDVFVRNLQSGTTTLVSVNKDGTDSGTGEHFRSVISPDGRFVAFESTANDLVATDTNGAWDVFVRDLQSQTTTLVTVNKDGTDSGNYGSSNPVFSADGRFVAFSSHAVDLVVTDTNYMANVFVRDLQLGTTTLVSVNIDGTRSGNSDSYVSAISADGRFVAFESEANDLVATDTNGARDVFVRDLQSETTTLVSVNKDGTDSGTGNSTMPVPMISADGRFVVFESHAADLVATDTNGWNDVFVRDLQSGTTTLVSVNNSGTDSGNSYSWVSAISTDDRYVAFVSRADDLVATDTNGTLDVFVRDLQSVTTTLVSVNKDGTDSGSDASNYPEMSADGRFVTFSSAAHDLVATDTNSSPDVFVRDLQSGTTTLVSVNKDGTDAGTGVSSCPMISTDGRFLAFDSNAGDLVAADTNGLWDVFAFEAFEVSQGCNCADPDAIKGTSGRDFLYGTEQADIICALGGNDFIAGKGGDDCIDAGDGNDWIYGGRGNDTIFGQAGKDVVYGYHGNDNISGNEGSDYLFGGVGDDKLDGGEGYDRVYCGLGTDEGIGEYVRGCEN
jgi:Ca2+-binding RTX toxin-like protein